MTHDQHDKLMGLIRAVGYYEVLKDLHQFTLRVADNDRGGRGDKWMQVAWALDDGLEIIEGMNGETRDGKRRRGRLRLRTKRSHTPN